MKGERLIFIIFCIIIVLLNISCEKDPKIITKTITKTDTVIVSNSDTIYLNTTDTVVITNLLEDTLTTFIVLRHAETESGGSDPNLSMEGINRSHVLKDLLQNIPLSAIYSSNYNRTLQTAEPIAEHNSLVIETYNPFALKSLINNVLNTHFSKVVLVVGHSNTTPSLINELIGTNKYSNIPESEYDNLYIISLPIIGDPHVLHLKY